YATVYRLHLAPLLGPRKVRTLTRGQVKAHLIEKKTGGQSPESVRLMRAVLGAMLNAAIDDQVISSNPAARLGAALGLSRQQSDTDEIKAMTPEQLSGFLAAVPTTWQPIFHTLAKTGMRLGEALGLQWADVDLEGATCRIKRNLTKRLAGTP